MLIISWARGETISLHDLCAQLGTHCFRAATTFTTRNPMTLKSCDILVNTSRRHESEDKNARHMGSVLHIQHGKIQLCNDTGLFLHGMFCYAQYDINTHDLCTQELK